MKDKKQIQLDKFNLVALLIVSCQASAQGAEGEMDCMVTGNVVVASEEGKFKTYSGIKGGVKVNEKLILSYMISKNSIYIALKREQVEKATVISAYLSTDNKETTSEKSDSGGFILKDNKYGHSISFLPDYIRINEFRQFFLSRYYKNDWHGIYSFVDPLDSSSHTLTLNCRHTNDKMDTAFKIFNVFKGQK
jgi:hypothetical protein